MKIMKKGIAMILTLMLCLSLLPVAGFAAEQSVTLDPDDPDAIELNLKVGDTVQFSVKDAENYSTIYWWSSENSGISVDQNGLATAVTSGSGSVGVELTQGEDTFGVTCEVTVYQALTGVSLEPDAMTVKVGGTGALTPVFQPADANNQGVTWTSSNEDVAAVNSGVVTGVAAGVATITVTTDEGGFTATCKVTVVEPELCTVTFQANGGSQTEPAEVEAGTPLAKPADPTRDGYRFLGWYLDNGTVYDFSRNVSGDMTLTAQWREKSADEPDTTDYTSPSTGAAASVGSPGSSGGGSVSAGSGAAAQGGVSVVTVVSDEAPASSGGTVEIVEEDVPLAGLPALFPDVVGSDWYYNAVAFVSQRNLMNGCPNGDFEPDAGASRAMVVTVLHRLAGSPAATGDGAYWDVKSAEYYAGAVAWATDNGIITGFPDGTFRPDKIVTREQLAAILYRYAAYKGASVTASADLSGFSDAAKAEEYARQPLSWAVALELIQGYNGKLSPNACATRAQVASILMRMDSLDVKA